MCFSWHSIFQLEYARIAKNDVAVLLLEKQQQERVFRLCSYVYTFVICTLCCERTLKVHRVTKPSSSKSNYTVTRMKERETQISASKAEKFIALITSILCLTETNILKNPYKVTKSRFLLNSFSLPEEFAMLQFYNFWGEFFIFLHFQGHTLFSVGGRGQSQSPFLVCIGSKHTKRIF